MDVQLRPWLSEWIEVEALAQGGQGVTTILQSRTNSLRRAVLKQIVDRWRDDSQARERLEQETSALVRLHGAGARVPEVYDWFGKHQGCEPFLVMEYIHGIRFDKWLVESAPTTPDQAVKIVDSIAETIALCHRNKIGHRDLKPANLILKDGRVDQPYVLDFGISFDSLQTVALTKKGEIFRNEFISLPECQDLRGGHQDLRSDITALAGIFFTCVTGRSPLVLRDAEDASPHRRHRDLVRAAAKDAEQAERLTWFFDRAFAYRINERFQVLDEFIRELNQFADAAPSENLEFFEQLGLLDKTLNQKDRRVQIAALVAKYTVLRERVMNELRDKLNRRQSPSVLQTMGLNIATLPERPEILGGGELLDQQTIPTYVVSRQPYDQSAVAQCTAFAVGMQIHFYVRGYTAHDKSVMKPINHAPWTKTAIVDENLSPAQIDESLSVVKHEIEKRLAFEMKKLTRAVLSQTDGNVS